jgi:hypothetical protein
MPGASTTSHGRSAAVGVIGRVRRRDGYGRTPPPFLSNYDEPRTASSNAPILGHGRRRGENQGPHVRAVRKACTAATVCHRYAGISISSSSFRILIGVATLCEAPNARGGRWSSDGVVIFTPSPADALFRVESGGGNCRALTRLSGDTERSHRWPQFLPDGRRFLYLATFKLGGNLKPAELRIGSLDAPDEASVAVRIESSAVYGAGHILFMRAGMLMALKLDPEKGETSGDAFPVADHVRTDVNFHSAVSASSTGVLYRSRTTRRGQRA